MWLDRVVKWLLPKEMHFYDLLERGAACALEASVLLVACCEEQLHARRGEFIKQLTDVEHKADRVIVEVYDALNRTFVTPLDRSDIYKLATDLEGITDIVFATVLQIDVHSMDELPEDSQQLAHHIKQACDLINSAVASLRGMRRPGEIRELCKQLNRLESEGDRIFRSRIGEMFKHEKDAIRLLKHKEFLEGLERTLDACDDVGNALDTIAIKNA
jgi:uncharacterized protein Yka (UPF0111/DUF47 family)